MKTGSRPPRISMRDIAQKLGVSHVTISLALRNHPRISEATRIQVHQMAEKMGYRPDPMLSALANYRKHKSEKPITSALAWINAWTDPKKLRSYKEFDLYWQGVSEAAEKYGYRLEEFRLDAEYTPIRLHQILTARGIRGILLPPQETQPDWGDFPWGDYSVVRFGRSLQSPRSHLVTADQVANTMLAFQKMRNRGYRRIGFVTDETDLRLRGQLFEAGYLTAQRLVDETERVPILAINDYPERQHRRALLKWLEENKVDAIFTNVSQIPAKLEAMGIKVPQDVAIAGTSILDTNISAGIDQHPKEIGRVAFLMLNSLINDGARGIPPIFRQILVEGSWASGNSLPDQRL